MYSLTVRDHIMIAHSLRGAAFGPAQQLHGATFVVDVTFRRADLDANGIVIDIGRASDHVKAILAAFNYRNLDADPSLAGRNTTTEVLAREIFDRVAHAIRSGDLGDEARGVSALVVTLRESHLAWASYEGRV